MAAISLVPRAPGRLAAWLAVLLWAVTALAAVPAWAQDDPPGRVGRVTDAQGQSWFFDSDGGEWVTLQRNRPLTTGARIAVDPDARLELRIGSTAVRLAGGSDLEVARLDDERIDLTLIDGSAAVRVRSPEVAREVALTTALGRYGLQGPGYFRVDRRGDRDVATAWLGELRFEADDSALDLPAGRSAEFWREAGVTHYAWSEPAHDAFADWAARADRNDDSAALPPYVSPEMTGAEDLDRYGTWETTADYGPLWIPTTVVAGWAPYRFGHWVWAQPWGWNWVDDAPWGFAPFHYGRWVHYGGRWCWAPGQRVAHPVYAPALVAWVGNATPGRGPRPYVGWVPLAPREPYYPHYRHGGSYWGAVNAGQMRMFAPGTPHRPPTTPSWYVNQGVAGAVSIVPGRELVPRRPVAPVVARVDAGIRHRFATQPTRTLVPPPGVARPIAVPGAAIPRPPGRSPAPANMPSPRTPAPEGWHEPHRVPPPVATTPAQPRATIAPRDTRPRDTRPREQPGLPPARAVTPPGDPARATPPPAAPAVRAPTPQAQPERQRAPRRPEPSEPAARPPGHSAVRPVAPALPSAHVRRVERVAPPVRPPEMHRQAHRSDGPPRARVGIPEWRGHPSRAHAQ